jgi:flagellar operon protein
MSLMKGAGLTGMSPPMTPPVSPLETLRKNPQGPVGAGASEASEFKKALEQVTQGQAAQGPNSATRLQGLQGTQPTVAADKLSIDRLKFSNHAIERMRSRGINFPPEQMKNIENAISKAASKGAKDTLVLAGDNALIVSVKNNTVVTVMDRAAMKDNVFTNIDSTVVV